MKRALLLSAVAFAGAVVLGSVVMPEAACADPVSEPVQAPIQALDQAIAEAQKTRALPFPARYKALAPAVDQAFDLQQLLQKVVGLPWAGFKPDQKARLLAIFRAYTIASYVAILGEDTGDTIRLLPETRTIGADKVVETQIVPAAGDPTRIDYVMRNTAGAWKAIDVLEQGTISQVNVQRSDFRSLVASGADALIASLQAKVDKLSGGTIGASSGQSPGQSALP